MDTTTGRRCPKCGHEQPEQQAECAACGLIFARYQQRQEKQLATPAEDRRHRAAFSPARLAQLALLVLFSSSLTWYLTSKGQQPAASPQAESVVQTTGSASAPLAAAAPAEAAKVADPVQAKPVLAGDSPIEHARKATVTIVTPWGSGSGFFISDSYIITNKHVVAVDSQQLASFRNRLESARKAIQLGEKQLSDQQKNLRLAGGGQAAQQARERLHGYQQDIARARAEYAEGEKRLAIMERGVQAGDIKIVLADNSEHAASYLVTSRDHDLALLTVFARNSAWLQRPTADQFLKQGDTLYTVGSPAGLSQTVTKGIHSGYRKREADGTVFIQTDAPINPGNSGGPLIDEKGFVRGVNSMVMAGAQGIGFAIPIEQVYQEFSTVLR